jgi:hypothetical protein
MDNPNLWSAVAVEAANLVNFDTCWYRSSGPRLDRLIGGYKLNVKQLLNSVQDTADVKIQITKESYEQCWKQLVNRLLCD